MLRAPFPWFGGKSRAASLIREREEGLTTELERLVLGLLAD